MNKACTKCGVEKPTTEFYKHKENRDGLRGACKACHSKAFKTRYYTNHAAELERGARWRRENQGHVRRYSKHRYSTHREEERERGAAYRAANPEKDAARHHEYYEENRERLAGYNLGRLYGITQESYDMVLGHQENRCAVCGKPQGWDMKKHHVDHDHDTGLVRGILCNACNGHLDDPRVKRTPEMDAYIDSPPAQAVLGELSVPGWASK